MSYKINPKECINCGICAGECPENAISKQEESYFIDASKCTNCGICEHFCPVSCIFDENSDKKESNDDDF